MSDTPTLLTTSQNKLDKSLDYGYMTAGITLSPATEYSEITGEAVQTLCASAGECAKFCLSNTGRYVMSPAIKARINRTRFMIEARNEFLDQAEREIARFARRARKKGYKAAIRPNLLSDLTWLGRELAERLPGVQFYDYTKHRAMVDRERLDRLPPNYHLTYSISERDIADAMIARGEMEGINCAVVLDTPKGSRFPKTMPILDHRVRVIDGDKHDLRFLDPDPAIVGLRYKGNAVNKVQAINSGFVVRTSPAWYGA